MRYSSLFAAIAAVCVGLAAPEPASANGTGPRKVQKVRTVKKAVYPAHCYCFEDPYAYRYSPRGYYPYYGSNYWVPAHIVRKRNRVHYNVWNVQPPRYRYYRSWGYPKRWHHKEWHYYHHGYHHRWHW